MDADHGTGMTIVEKILARAAGLPRVFAGDILTIPVDRAVMLDTTFFFLRQMRREILAVPHPDRIVIVFDHEVPAPSATSAAAQRMGREFAARWGIRRFHDVGFDQGISHVLLSENCHALPGMFVVGSDSHSAAAGVMNCAARAVTIIDLIAAVATGETWLQLAPTVRYDFVGRLGPGVAAMDVILHIADRFGSHAGSNIEFGGEGMAGLSIDARRTISTMCTELNCEFATFEADDILIRHIESRTAEVFLPVHPDADADYLRREVIDLSAVRPMVARPDQILGNTGHAGTENERIDQAFIGSCANGSLSDIAAAAAVLRGRRVADGVRLIVTPASQAIYRAALSEGHIQTLAEAGAIVTNATCGACAGGHMGVLGPGDNCIATATRNFKGRMGDASARIWLASPATVAASAVAGRIAEPSGLPERAHFGGRS